MTSHQNAFAIYDYQKYLNEARGLHEATIDAASRYIRQFEDFTGGIDFARVSRTQIISFKESIRQKAEDENCLSPSTVVHSLRALGAFFSWLVTRPEYGKLARDLPDYFTPSKRLVKIANAPTDKYVPSVDEIRKLIAASPRDTLLQRRDRAIIAFLYLTGVRNGALVTLRLKHVDTAQKLVFQDAREVATKASKTMRTAWFPVGEDFEEIVINWVAELRGIAAKEDVPLFPRGFRKEWGASKDECFEFLSSTDPVRKIIKAAAAVAETVYFRPHAIRATIGRNIERWGATAEERKALSQNLGHERYVTTREFYGALPEDQQHALIANIRDRGEVDPQHDILQPFARAPENIRTALIEILKPYR
ncbi:tyrosine-type recombinase/integrase [Rhizobium sp. 0TCS1.26]|uniref:tyrosine-type recombinase/integrase n=1 Tax=Rhizobium sp. 0TCS1.26 TaxID=3142623 RepID=UPI003D2CDA65